MTSPWPKFAIKKQKQEKKKKNTRKKHKELKKKFFFIVVRDLNVCLQHCRISKTLVLHWFQLFSEADLYFSVVWLAMLGSPAFPHLHRATGGQILHPEAHLLGKLHCWRNAMVGIQVWHTILELKENGGQMHNGERDRQTDRQTELVRHKGRLRLES